MKTRDRSGENWFAACLFTVLASFALLAWQAGQDDIAAGTGIVAGLFAAASTLNAWLNHED